MLSVVKSFIQEEVKNAHFVAIQTGETTDISTHCQLVLVLHYIDANNNIQEWFLEFISIQDASADTSSSAFLERLHSILPELQKAKLIAQAYDGATVMRGATGGVQRYIMDVYENARYVHCYAHQLKLIMQQATSHLPRIGTFFWDLAGFSAFFSRSPNCSSGPGCPEPPQHTHFHSRAVNAVHEHKDDLLRCFQVIRDCQRGWGLCEDAGGRSFLFLSALFHQIPPHVDLLFNQLQKRNSLD